MAEQLLELARKRFAPRNLSKAEEDLCRAAQNEAVAVQIQENRETPDLANAASWPPDSVVRAECVAWLCTNREAFPLVTHRGIRLRCIRIDGELDLDYAQIKFPLSAWKCVFTGNVLLRYARLEGLFFEACHIKDVQAYGLFVTGDFLLSNGFTPEGEIDTHNVCKVEGELNLLGATIGGTLDCSGAQLLNPTKIALSAGGAKIGHDVFLKNGFKAVGEVSLVGATIEGNLECDAAEFVGSQGCALSPNSAKIGGSVYLADGFKAVGEVNLAETTIGRVLEIRKVIEPDKLVLNLRSTKVATFLDDIGSWPSPDNLMLDGFRYERFHERAPVEAERRKDWLSRQRRHAFLPQPYEQLATVLRAMGHERDARFVMIEKNRERGRFTRFPRQAWWWYKLFGWLIGYGYRPQRAFALSVVLILLGTILFWGGYSCGLISPTTNSAYEKDAGGAIPLATKQKTINPDYPVFNPIAYSMESFLPLVKFDQSANWQPNANRIANLRIGGWNGVVTGSALRWYLWFHIVSGWVLTTLWVGAVTGLVKS